MAQLFKLLFVLFLLLFLLTLCVSVYASSNKETKKDVESVELFKPNLDKIKTAKKPDGSNDDETFKNGIIYESINLPQFIVAAKGNVMVAVTEANFTKKIDTSDDDDVSNKKTVDVVTKYLKVEEENKWNINNIKDVEGKLTTQFATKKSIETNLFSKVIFSVVNEESDKIYVFLLNTTEVTSSDTTWKVTLLTGTVNINESDGKIIKWENKDLTFSKTTNKKITDINEKKILLDDASGFAFLIKENKIIVCVIKCKYQKEGTDGNEKESITAIFQLKEDGNNLELLHVDNIDGKHLSFFQWGGELFKTPTNEATGGVDKVMVFDTTKNNFADSGSSIARLRNFFKNKNNFATVTIENKSLLLFTEEKKKDTGNKKDVYLWISDGTRAYCVGNIISDIEDTFYGFILYTNNELFALHQKYDTGNSGKKEKDTFLLTRLKELLDNMTFILDAWEESNKIVVELCREINIEGSVCTLSLLTDGLVGFLHNTVNNENTNEWKDEYFYSNASVENGKMESKDVKFSGAGQGAKWPLKDKNDQPYSFVDFGFTLMASVTINGDTNGKVNSVLGVGLNGNKNTVGLWCTTDGKWGVSGKEKQSGVKSSDVLCEHGKMYQVVFILNNTNVVVYLNGIQLTLRETSQINIQKSDTITHFYIGVDVNSEEAKTKYESHVTVKNVLLYNRPFTKEEAEQMKIKQMQPPQTDIATHNEEIKKEITDNPQVYSSDTEGPSGTSDSPTTNTAGDEGTVPSGPRESAVRVSVGDIVVVSVLLVVLFGGLG